MTTLPSNPLTIPSNIPGPEHSWPLVVRETIQAGPVTVTRYGLTDAAIREGDPSITVLPRLAAAPPVGYVYVNPEYSVVATAEAPRDRFLRQARHYQLRWHQRVDRLCGNATARRMIRAANQTERQLRFSGVLMIDGRPVPADDWPDRPPLSPGKRRSRERFERLKQQAHPCPSIGELLAAARNAAAADAPRTTPTCSATMENAAQEIYSIRDTSR